MGMRAGQFSASPATQQRVATALSCCLIAIFVAFLTILVGGERFRPILQALGLAVPAPGGVYADCSRDRNSRNRFCAPPPPDRASRSWRDMKRGNTRSLPFVLHGE